ncbi:uncharacterized protein LOC144363599 [Saccoglossus kowalevskii]
MALTYQKIFECQEIIHILPVLLTVMVTSQGVAFADDGLCFPCTVNGDEICLLWSLRCDGESHCDNDADELFDTCYGDSCVALLPNTRRCDGAKDCQDGRDEYYDGCHDDEVETSVTLFGSTSIAVAAIFLISVVILLIGFVFCICCCCRKGRQSSPYIANKSINNDGTVNGYRFVSHMHPLSTIYSTDDVVVYDLNEETV